MKHKHKAAALLLVLALALALVLTSREAKEPLLSATVETTILPHYAEISGKLLEAPLELGQPVEAGDIIAVLDDSRERYNIEQLQTVLERKQAVLDELLAGADAEERRQADNNVRLAQQALSLAQLEQQRAQKDYDNAALLAGQGGAPQKTVDDAAYRLDLAREAINSATTRLDTARQQANLIAKGVAQEKITAAEADIALTQSQLCQSEDNLALYTVYAQQAGIVISKNYHAGAMVNAGYNLLDIASQDERYAMAYVPEDNLHSISYGQQLTLRGTEGEYIGTVNYIDVKAQFTPKENQTTANRNKNSFKIKVLLPPDAPWRPGENVEVLLPPLE